MQNCLASDHLFYLTLAVSCMQAAKDYEDMAAELHKHTQLSNMFDCPEAVVSATEGVAAIKGDLVLVKDVWDASSLVEQQFQVCWAPFVMVLYKTHVAVERAFLQTDTPCSCTCIKPKCLSK